ncbi:MAG: hypothetical protein PHQ72_03535 [Hespellia sp.]|nr:hypothetical protein [Hespellia sp.]
MKQVSRVRGTIGLENSLKQAPEENRYDEIGKKVFRHKEVLANILKYSVPEYEHYSCQEIMGFIEGNSISVEDYIALDTDSRIAGDDTTMTSRDETNLTFDVKFRVLQPVEKPVHLHIDIELQGKYHPGYPIEKRGIYNLSRLIGSQIEVVNAKTNYNKLEKAYCIFICVGNLPQYLWNTVSYYKFTNTKNIGDVVTKEENYDLMGLVIIRIGEAVDKNIIDIIRFLHGIFYDVTEVDDYIDFSDNEEFRKEMGSLAITGEHLIEYGQHIEQENTRKEKERAEKAEARAEKAEHELEILYRRIEELEKRIKQ